MVSAKTYVLPKPYSRKKPGGVNVCPPTRHATLGSFDRRTRRKLLLQRSHAVTARYARVPSLHAIFGGRSFLRVVRSKVCSAVLEACTWALCWLENITNDVAGFFGAPCGESHSC